MGKREKGEVEAHSLALGAAVLFDLVGIVALFVRIHSPVAALRHACVHPRKRVQEARPANRTVGETVTCRQESQHDE